MVELSDEKVLYAFDKTLEPALTVPCLEAITTHAFVLACARCALPIELNSVNGHFQRATGLRPLHENMAMPR